jgi:WD40 repeat protein
VISVDTKKKEVIVQAIADTTTRTGLLVRAKITATLTDPRSKGVESVAYAPGGTTLAAADTNGSTYLWDIATKTITATLTDPRSEGVESVAFRVLIGPPVRWPAPDLLGRAIVQCSDELARPGQPRRCRQCLLAQHRNRPGTHGQMSRCAGRASFSRVG